MKFQGLYFVALSFLVLVLGLASVYVFIQSHPSTQNPVLLQAASVSDNQSARFNSVESEDDFRLTYEWKDFGENDFSVSFSLSKSTLREAEEEFGYFPDELEDHVHRSVAPLRKEMIDRLRKTAQKLIDKSRYSEYLSIEEDTENSFNLRLSAPPSMHSQIETEFKRITSEMARQQSWHYKKIEKESSIQRRDFLSERGLRFIGDRIGVNYGLLVKSNQKRVKPALESLLRESRGLSFQQILSLLLSYIQEIRYGIPPLTENGKYIVGFWVPPKVLINNFGDCDSKGVTFASLWIGFKRYPILLIKIPNHLFIGLAVPSFSSEGVTINGLRYTLCEVAGPEKLPPGIITPHSQMYFQGGHYSYELIR